MTAELPIACSLTAADQKDRGTEWRDLFARGGVTRSGSAVRAEFDSLLAGEVADLAAAEKRCCPFFGFVLEFSGAHVVLTVTAPDGVAAGILDNLGG